MREPPGRRMRPPITHHAWYVLRSLAQEMHAVAKGLGPGTSIIDLGCGVAPYRSIFAATGVEYVTADLEPGQGVDLVCDEYGRVPAQDGTFDIVLSNQVLEHVPDPQAYLCEARRLLKGNGLLILTTHGTWIYHPDPLDLWRWTGPGLVREVEHAGFEFESIKGKLGPAGVGLQLIQDALRRRTPHLIRPLLQAAFQVGIYCLDHLHSNAEREVDASVFVLHARAPRAASASSSVDL